LSQAISIKGVLIEDGRVVLLENERGEWELPGGRPERSENPQVCLVREFAEELGTEVAVGPLVDCWNYEVLPGRHVMIVTYAVTRSTHGPLRLSAEHRRLAWFEVGALASLPLPEGYRQSIAAVAREPGWLAISREMQAIAQTGLHYAQDKFDQQRYARLRGLATEMMASGSDNTVEQIAGLFQEAGSATPRIGVRGAAFHDGRILMVREVTDGRWSLPGGWADVNQSAGQCVEREIWEESGFTARAVKLAAVWDKSRHGHPPYAFSIYSMFFLCEITGGTAQPSVETSEIAFFAEDELPELSPGRVRPHQVKRMFAHYRQPDLPTEFD
jgi:ADP-ribose pyrophosphatase YjhB (NUDIX family)